MKINHKIAILEAALAAGLLYGLNKPGTNIGKISCGFTAGYLLYGAYLNSQNRVKLLPPAK